MKLFKTLYCLLILTLCASCHFSPKNLAEIRPNILLILADDMGYGDVSNEDNQYLKTPHLDNMAMRSVNFEHFYVSPVCAPTRASLLTGRYHQEVGVRSVTNGFEIMDPDAITIAEILKDVGYRTAIFGKWHLGEYYPSTPNAQGFDEYLGFRTGHTADYFDAVLEHNGKPEPTEGYITDMFADKALQFMEAKSENPFFCYLAYNAPHSPLQIEESKLKHFLDMGLNDKTARVYAMVENIDENIGKIISSIESSGNLDNTIIIFLSDNGPISGWQVPQEKMRYNAGLRDQKFTTYEGGIRTQCYWMWNGNWEPFDDSLSLAAHIDLVPTLAEILNISLPDSFGVDGTSLKRVLDEQIPLDEKRMIFEEFDLTSLRNPQLFSGGIARQSHWKMVKGSELYNLKEDSGEQHNLADLHPEVLKELNLAYSNYYNDVYSNTHVLPLPIKVGYDEENPVCLKSHHGVAKGNVQFMGFRGHYNESYGTHPTGVDGSWTSNWKEAGDAIQWEIEFIEKATYEISITANGRIGLNTCALSLDINGQSTSILLPEIKKEEQWKNIHLLSIEAGQLSNISLQLQKKGTTDSLNINEIVITKL